FCFRDCFTAFPGARPAIRRRELGAPDKSSILGNYRSAHSHWRSAEFHSAVSPSFTRLSFDMIQGQKIQEANARRYSDALERNGSILFPHRERKAPLCNGPWAEPLFRDGPFARAVPSLCGKEPRCRTSPGPA